MLYFSFVCKARALLKNCTLADKEIDAEYANSVFMLLKAIRVLTGKPMHIFLILSDVGWVNIQWVGKYFLGIYPGIYSRLG